MPIDETTPRLGLQKPAQPNTLRHDVVRLRNSLDAIDEKVAVLVDDPNNPGSKIIDPAVIPSNIARWDAAEVISSQHMPSDVPLMTKDATGKYRLAKDQLPIGSGTVVHNVASETLMTQIADAQVGDIAHIDNTERAYMLSVAPASARRNWMALSPDIPATVSATGENTNIKALNGLTERLTLAMDGASGLDAVTVQQMNLTVAGAVASAATSSSGTGASLAQVISDFTGSVQWFNGTRSIIPAGYLPADGQCLSRQTHSALYAAVSSGMLKSVTDADWLKDNKLRGQYSKGDVANCPDTTITGAWFRMPDLNGGLTDSTPAVFLRGDGLGKRPALGEVGTIVDSAAPNIVGTVYSAGTGVVQPNKLDGAFLTSGPEYSDAAQGTPKVAANTISFNANRSHPAYGRARADNTAPNEISPNAATGIWLIRVNGAFSSNATQLMVANKIPTYSITYPGAASIVNYNEGGLVGSEAYEGDTRRSLASLKAMYCKMSNGPASNYAMARLGIVDNMNGRVAFFDFKSDGSTRLPGTLRIEAGLNNPYQVQPGIELASRGGIMITGNVAVMRIPATAPNIYTTPMIVANVTYGTNTCPVTIEQVWCYGKAVTTGGSTVHEDYQALRFTANSIVNGKLARFEMRPDGNIYFSLASAANGQFAKLVSDRKVKANIVDAKPGALDRITQMRPVEFNWINDDRRDRGYIAQELEVIDPLYAFRTHMGDADDEGTLNVSYNAILADLIGAVKELKADNDALRAELAALKS